MNLLDWVKQTVLSSLLYLVIALAALAGWLYWIQPRLIFYPMPTLQTTPADWGMAFEEVMLTTEDGLALHGWYLPAPGADKTLLFFHGNAGNISHRGESLRIFHRLGLNVLIIDYRGYGRSEGDPDEQGLYRDGRAAWRYLTDERGIGAGDIIIFGRSLGGAVAAQLASEVNPNGLIIESSFSSARDFVRTTMPLLSYLVVLRYGFDSVAKLPQVHCPVLVMHSPEDEIMPYSLGEKLYQAAGPAKQFWPLRGDHNGGFLRSQPGYEQRLVMFINSLSRHAE